MTYKERSDYFKMIAIKNKRTAHEQPVSEGSDKLRKSYHRINDLDELNAACVNWAHFPCIVHVGEERMYRQSGTGLPAKINGSHLYFLDKLPVLNGIANAMELAYDAAEKVMSEFISYLQEDKEVNGVCGNMGMFDVNRASAEQIGPFNDVLFGWHLTFYLEEKDRALIYNSNDWYE